MFLQIFKKNNISKKVNSTYVFNKSLIILKSFKNEYSVVYKGNLFRRLKVIRYILGYKFGEFTHTRKPFNYPLKKNKNIRR